MTIICYRDGIMAADSAIWSGNEVIGHRQKIIRVPKGGLVSATGASGPIQRFTDWICEERSAPPKRFSVDSDDFYGIWVDVSGFVNFCGKDGAVIRPYNAPFFALGASDEMARGAMAAGASAEEAVRICIDHHAFAGGTVQVEFLVVHKAIAPARSKREVKRVQGEYVSVYETPDE